MAPKYQRPDAWRWRDAAGYMWLYVEHYPDVPQHYEVESLYGAGYVSELLNKIQLLERQIADTTLFVKDIIRELEKDIEQQKKELEHGQGNSGVDSEHG